MNTIAAERAVGYGLKKRAMTAAEYLLVDVDRQRCDLYRKGADGLWVLHPSGATEPLHLASVDLRITPEALWADLEPVGEGEADAPAA